MRIVLIMTILALPCLSVRAAEVNVAGTSIQVPTPQGFARLTRDMQPLYDVAQDTTNPNNKRLVTFVDENIVPLALAGEAPALERFINIEVMRKLESVTATPSDFAQLQALIRDDLDQAIAKLEQSMPEKMEGLSNRVSETLDIEVALALSNVVPMPVHRQNKQLTSHSMFIKYEMSNSSGKEDFIVTLTTTFLFLKGKILYVYVYGGPKDLSWTRKQASQLIDEIVSAN